MTRNLLKTLAIACILGGGIGLAGCSGGGDGAMVQPPAPPPPTPAAIGPERFGTGFALSFRAAANSDAREPMQADLFPTSFTTDPFDVP